MAWGVGMLYFLIQYSVKSGIERVKGTYLPPQFFLFGLSFHLLNLNLSTIIKKHVHKYAITYFK